MAFQISFFYQTGNKVEKPQREIITVGMAWDVIIREARLCYFHKPKMLMAL